NSARRITSTRKVCGVCTAQRRERSRVRSIVCPSRDSLIVSVTACAATAAPCSRAACTVATITASLVHGRAASWIATISDADDGGSHSQTLRCKAQSPKPKFRFDALIESHCLNWELEVFARALLAVLRVSDHANPIYVEILIRGKMEDLWRMTQTPECHQRW